MESLGKLVAACLVDGGGAGGFVVVGGIQTSHPGVVSAVRNAKGDYTITTSEAIDSLDALPSVQLGDTLASGGESTMKILTDTTFQIKIFDNAGAAQDNNFWFQLRRMGVNGGG